MYGSREQLFSRILFFLSFFFPFFAAVFSLDVTVFLPSSPLLLKFLQQGRERLTLLHLHLICSSFTLFNKGMNDHLCSFVCLGLGISIFQAGIISFSCGLYYTHALALVACMYVLLHQTRPAFMNEYDPGRAAWCAYKFTNHWWAGLLVFWRCNILLVCGLEGSVCVVEYRRCAWPGRASLLLHCWLLAAATSASSSARPG